MPKNSSNTYQAFWVGLGSFSSFGLAIISAAILSRYFDKSEYGTYRQILYVYNTLLVVFTVGLPNVFSYYLPRYTLSQGKEIVWKVSKMLFFFGAVFSLFLFIFSGQISLLLKNPELSTGLKYFSIIPMFLMPTLGIEGIFATYRKTVFIAIYNVITRLLMLLFIVLPVIILRESYLYAIYGWIIVSIITFIIAWFFKEIPFKGIAFEESGLKIKEILSYSFPLVVASVAGVAIKAANQFYISRFFGVEVFAEFSNGFIELPFVQMITGATATVLMPMFSKIVFDKTNIKELSNLWQNALYKSAIFIYPLVIFSIFYAKEIVTILYSSKYESSSIYFSVALTINFFNIIIFAPLLLSLGATKFYAKLHLYFAIIVWIIGYFVVLIFNSPIAIAIFSALQSNLMVLVAMLYVSNITKIKFIKLLALNKLSIVVFHSILAILVTKFMINDILDLNCSNYKLILCSFFYYVFNLVLISPIFKINYWFILRPLFSK